MKAKDKFCQGNLVIIYIAGKYPVPIFQTKHVPYLRCCVTFTPTKTGLQSETLFPIHFTTGYNLLIYQIISIETLTQHP